MAETSAAGAVAAGDFRVGSVFERSFAMMFGYWPVFLLLGAMASLPDLGTAMRLWRGSGPEAAAWLIGGIVGLIVQAMMVHAAFQAMRQRPVRLGETVRQGVARFFPVLGASICFGIMIGIGFLLLIVPGLIFAAMFFITIPVCVVERLGPVTSMVRSAELTKGERWKVFGIFLLSAVPAALVQGLIKGELPAVAGAGSTAFAGFVWDAFVTAYTGILGVTTYHDLRVAKEGVDIERIAAVFD